VNAIRQAQTVMVAPCGHCGSHSVSTFEMTVATFGVDHLAPGEPVMHVACDDCGMSGPVTSWNKRTPVERPVSEAQALSMASMIEDLREGNYTAVELLGANPNLKAKPDEAECVKVAAPWTIPSYGEMRFTGPTIYAALKKAVAMKDRRLRRVAR
jgi:hypothetical protein